MRPFLVLAAFGACASFAVLAGAATQPAPAPDGSAWAAEISAWKKERTKEIASERGWLAVSGLFWLNPGENVAGTRPSAVVKLPDGPAVAGVFARTGPVVTWKPADGPSKVIESDTAPWKQGRAWLQLLKRQDRIGLRMWDAQNARKLAFQGLKYFALDPKYRVTGRFTPHAKPMKIEIANVLGQVNEMETPGVVDFEIDGQTYRLTPVYETSEKVDLFYIFRDETAAKTTYGAGRFLHGPHPAKDGSVVLDFNKAYSPPCAFTDFATCPLPPAANRIRVAIPAGELDPH